MGRGFNTLVNSLRRSGHLILITLTLFLALSVSHAQGNEGALEVSVTNTAGRPLKNACVTFIPREGEILFRKADRNGKVKIRKMAAGRYRVVVKVDGYEAQKKEVVVNSSAGTVAFSLQPRS